MPGSRSLGDKATAEASVGPPGAPPPGAVPTDGDVLVALAGAFGDREVRSLARRPFESASSYAMERVRVRLDDRCQVNLVLKNLAWGQLLPKAATHKPSFLYQPLRYVTTYRRILAPAGVGPRCYGAVSDRDRGLHFLLLEDINGPRLGKVASFAVWRHAAGWLGRFHALYYDRPEAARALNPLLINFTAAYCQLWSRRAERALARSPDPRARPLLRLLDGYEDLAAAVADLPATLIHGEFYPSNVLIEGDHRETGDEPPRVCPVDWEASATGPGLFDLAGLSAGNWSEAERHALLQSYGEGLAAGGATVPPWDELLVAYARCRLQSALQWLGWSTGYRPPPGRGNDWLGEALTSARQLRRAAAGP